jgi:hypothetical protein
MHASIQPATTMILVKCSIRNTTFFSTQERQDDRLVVRRTTDVLGIDGRSLWQGERKARKTHNWVESLVDKER